MKMYNENEHYVNKEDGPLFIRGDEEARWRDDGTVAQTYDEMKKERAKAVKMRSHSIDDYYASISEPHAF